MFFNAFNVYSVMQSKFQKPSFGTIFDEIGKEKDGFASSLTDAGVCMVYNGNSISGTFTSNPKIDQLAYSVDPRHHTVSPTNINGTGRTSQMTLWVHAWDRKVKVL